MTGLILFGSFAVLLILGVPIAMICTLSSTQFNYQHFFL